MFYGLEGDRLQRFARVYDELRALYPDLYAADMLLCFWRNRSFLDDEAFMASYHRHARDEQERSLLWRLHTLVWAARQALHVDGDFVECGVLKGFCSAVVCDAIDFGRLPRRFHLYDTFAGLPEETSTEAERRAWDYSRYDPDALYADVCRLFAPYGNVEVVRGVVPRVFGTDTPERIAFLHIDMNSRDAEIAALDHLYDRVVPGGLIVFDDYGWRCNRAQMEAERDFMARRGLYVLELPTGQGLVVKPDPGPSGAPSEQRAAG